MADWLVWLVVAGACAVAEVLTLGLVLGMVAGAALVAAGVAGLGIGTAGQVATFAVATPALLLLVRPVARRHLLQSPPETRTGVAALVGQPAVVVAQVDGQGGQVRIGGEIWSARAYDGRQVIPEGVTADVLAIEGATALVHSTEQESSWQV